MQGVSAVESPMFDFVEQKAGVVREAPKKPELPDYVQNEQEFEDQTDYKAYLRDDYDWSEFEIAKQTIIILEDLGKEAKTFNDLATEVARDVYNECRMSWFRIAKIIETRSFHNKMHGMEELLEALDYMDKRIDKFRATYRKLKERRGADEKKAQLKELEKRAKKSKKKEEAKKESSSDEEESEDSEDEDEEEEEKNDSKQDPFEVDLLGFDDDPTPVSSSKSPAQP